MQDYSKKEEKEKAVTAFHQFLKDFQHIFRPNKSQVNRYLELEREQIESAHTAGQAVNADFPMEEFSEKYYNDTYL